MSFRRADGSTLRVATFGRLEDDAGVVAPLLRTMERLRPDGTRAAHVDFVGRGTTTTCEFFDESGSRVTHQVRYAPDAAGGWTRVVVRERDRSPRPLRVFQQRDGGPLRMTADFRSGAAPQPAPAPAALSGKTRITLLPSGILPSPPLGEETP